MSSPNRYRAPLLTAVVLMLCGVAVSVAMRPKKTEPKPPNVVVILIDTLRPDFLGVFGHSPDPSPFLTGLSEYSTVFENAYSTSSWTAPSCASLFTSLFPFEHGVTQGFYAHQDIVFQAHDRGNAAIPLNAISDSLTTLPEMFQNAGYSTWGVSANRNVGKEMGFDKGFDRFFVENDREAEGVYKKVQSWSREIERAEPYFLYVHFLDPHAPYRENPPYFARYAREFDELKAPYLSEISYMDGWIKRLFRMLRMDRNTLLVFVSDHGEEFFEHGNVQHGPFLYDELQRVLMMVYGPKLGVRSQRFDQNVSLVDVLPTLADFIGVPAPAESVGTSLLQVALRGPRSVRREFWDQRVLFGHRSLPVPPYLDNWSAIRGDWKYIEHVSKAPELFDHFSDPGEQDNVVDANADVAEALAAAITAARGAPRTLSGETLQVPVDEELVEELRSLGYTN